MLEDKDAEIKTKYDDFSVDELKAALKNIFFYAGEFSAADMKEMDQIMAVLEKKEPLLQKYTAEESWKRFQETYGEELSSLGVRDTEEVIQETAEVDSSVVSSIPSIESVHPIRHRRMLRIGLIAAIVLVFMVAVAATASALGYNLFGWVAKWSDEDIHFITEGPQQEPDEDDLQTIPMVLASLGIADPLYPNWLPEDLMRTYYAIDKEPLLLHESFSNHERFLSITISPTTGSETAVYQKDDDPPEEYLVGSVVHYIFENMNEITVVWYTENYTTLIVGNVSCEEMRRIINSVYEVR